MDNNAIVKLVIQTRVKPEKNHEFAKLQERMSEAATRIPGYLSQTITMPNPPLQPDWVIIQFFKSEKSAKEWLQSRERHALLKEALPMLLGVDNIFLIEEDKQIGDSVTATIVSKISKGAEQKFLDWNARIAPIQSKFPGFRGSHLERPKPGIHDTWVTIVTFDSNEHLEAWLKSAERKIMLDELNSFSSGTEVRKVHSGFDFWFTPVQDSRRLVWKENMLVVLTLYPVVFLLSFIQNPVVSLGMPFWLALFFSNIISTVILGSITVPFLMKIFSWWVHPAEKLSKVYDILGIFIVLILYIIILAGARFLSAV